MLVDQLKVSSLDQVAAAVLALLAGANLASTATHSGIAVADLHDALETYQAAGLAALQQRDDNRWYQVHIQFPDWATAEATFAEHVAPCLDDLCDQPTGWWFLRKHPCWRLRLQVSEPASANAVLDQLVADGAISQWRPCIYEPETAAFGGPAAMQIVHNLFRADSAGVLTYARQAAPGLGRREISLLLITTLQQHAGLDWYEAGDVFDRVTLMRPTPPDTDAAQIGRLAAKMNPVLATQVRRDNPLLAAEAPIAFAAPWFKAFARAGQELGDAAQSNRLDRGLRAVIAHIVIFHWNRLGLPATTQAILARAAKAAILPWS